MVSYDTPDVIAKKSQFIREQGLGGGMWWESSSDGKGDKSLISTVRFLEPSIQCIVLIAGADMEKLTNSST
jgi:GH18 family chitinase